MTEANVHSAENQISKQDSLVVAHHQSTQCYFCPETEELVFIADSEAGEFENHWREMMTRVNQFHLAKEAYSSALEAYGTTTSTRTLSSVETEAYTQKVTATEAKLEKEREALRNKLGAFSQEGMSYDDVVELLPIMGQGAKKKNGVKPARYAYVRKGYFSKSQQGRKLHTVSLKGNDKKGGTGSIYGKNKNGQRRIDTEKLKQQLTDANWPKIKLELKDIVQWSGLDFDPESLNHDFALWEWAEAWNKSLVGKAALGANVDVSGGAQFMRFVSNVGASAEFDPSKGNVALKGEAKATLTVASGMVNLTAYVPDRLGWSLSYTNAKGNTFDMGVLRLYLSPELNGFIGASVQVEGQLQVVTTGDKQLLAGQPSSRLPRFQERRTKGKTFHNQMAAEDEGLNLSGEAFAGVRAEGSLKGGVQWLKPTAPTDLNSPVAGLLKSSGEFTDFCTIGGSIGGMLGAGAGGKLHCTFINGKFCFHVAASLCWGAGAKGGFICEVGTNTIVEFGAWLVYQLYRLDYGFFDVVNKSAFGVYSWYCVLQMESVGGDLYESYGRLKGDVEYVADKFNEFIKVLVSENKDDFDASRRRNKLSASINANPDRLLHHTPEAKGILLYLLTRHGVWDHLDWGNRGKNWIPDIYGERKEAVSLVLKSIQTRAEWRKVLCRMTANGTSLAQADNELEIMEQQERHLVSFLQEGINQDKELWKAKSDLIAIYDRLKETVAWGYALAMNDTKYFDLNRVPNPHYPQRCIFSPCESQSSRWA
ncbi:ATPase [Pseudomonas sp. S09G 359]|uniref:ATPase n=1 Tax=Pseudomonas sp. S09G 359 TaxID=2054919 RepID=UPI0012FED5BF|nr:ATPase [Pseudomonas sp. S09G 359]